LAEIDINSTPDSTSIIGAIEHLPQLLSALTDQHDIWEHLVAALTISEIEAFTGHMQKLGKTHGYEPLAQWANDLADKTALFDMDGVQKTLGEFVHIGEEIRQHIAAQYAQNAQKVYFFRYNEKCDI
jgi:hypothetical protein